MTTESLNDTLWNRKPRPERIVACIDLPEKRAEATIALAREYYDDETITLDWVVSKGLNRLHHYMKDSLEKGKTHHTNTLQFQRNNPR